MKVVRAEPKSPILSEEYGRKLMLQFIAAHNEKIEKKERLLQIDAPMLKAAK